MKKRKQVLTKVNKVVATKPNIIAQNKLNFVPKVSVIIPVYNVSDYLAACLDSVLNQTLKEIEVICVNDGSTDNSLEILKDYATKKDKRITVVSRENMGVGYSRNEGIDLSKGEFISFMDPDDYYPETDTLEKMYNGAKKHKVKIAGGSLIVFDDNRKVEIRKHEPLESFKEDAVMAYKDFQYDYGFQRYIYDSSMIKGNKIYFPNYRRFQDPIFMIKAFECAGKFYAMTDYTYGYRWAHKDINWTEEKVYHLLCGLRDDLAFSADKHLWDLYERTLNRIKKEYKKVLLLHASERIKSLNKEVMALCLKVASERYKNQKLNAKVSVVLPIYNAEPYLRECLDSVVNQTLKEIEIICVNDGSTDNSLDIIKEYAAKDNRVRYIDKPNAGYGQTMNCGMDMATGEYIGIVEPDDYIELDAYEVLYKNAKKNNTDFVKADIYFWWSKANTRRYSNIITDKSLYNKVHTDLSQMGLIVGAIANCAGIYSKEFLRKNNIRYQETPGASFQDQGFYYQVMMYAKSGLFLNVPVYHYRQDNSNSSINTPDKVVCIFNEYSFVKKKLDLLPNKKSFLQLFYTKMINSYLWNLSNASADIYPMFRKKISEDFKHAIEIGELSKDLVGEALWKKVEPFIRDNFVIPIILSSDDNYAPFMYVTMLSMLENALPGTFYDFYLMVPSAFSKKNTDIISKLKDSYNCGIHFIDMKNQFSDLKMHISHITSPTYYRLLAGDLLPKEYDKCIYLDVDVCVCKDLTPLFNIDLGNNYIAGVPAAGYYFNESVHCTRLGLPEMKHYVNAGVLVMNLKKIREDNLTPKFLELSKKNYSSQDQDVINVACYGRIKILPAKYNAIPLRLQSNDSRLKDLFSDAELEEAKKDPVIIHYADKVKPWNSLAVYMGTYWWKYGSLAQKKLHFLNCPSLLKDWFKKYTEKQLNLENPRTFNEKIQWLKLYDSTPIKTRLADKYLVRDWVKEKIGEQYLIPLIGVYDKFEDIDFSKLPNRFVIKCNHGCGYNIIVKDKSKLDLKEVKSKLDKWLYENFAFKWGFELHYRDIPPKIIIEQYMENSGSDALYDYKFWCFNGEVKYMQFRDDFSTNLKMVFYNLDWVKQPFCYDHPMYDKALPKPDNFGEMVAIAKKLCQGFAFVCVDLYRLNDGTIYFGEMTFTRSSGIARWNDDKYNVMFGNMLKLPKLAYDVDSGKYYKLPKKSKVKTYVLFPYYLLELMAKKKQYKKAVAHNIAKQLQTLRVDIKNNGSVDNNVEVISTSNVKVHKPAWFKNEQGQGAVLESSDSKLCIQITAVKDGNLSLAFKAPDRRFEGKRFVIYAKYTSIKVDGRELLSEPISVWHDKPFVFAMPVKHGQVVDVVINQEPHKYEKSELKDLLSKLEIANAAYACNRLKQFICGRDKYHNDCKNLYTWEYIRNTVLTATAKEVDLNVFDRDMAGRLLIKVGKTKFETCLIPSNKKKLYVFLSAHGKYDTAYPGFIRVSWADKFDGMCLYVDDPTRVEQKYAPAFFFGNKYDNYLDKVYRIVKKIQKIHRIAFKDVIFISSSNGGFASIYLANKLAGSKCIALCPQVNAWVYSKGTIATKFGINSFELSWPSFSNRLNVLDFLKNRKSKFFIYSNLACAADAEQMRLLLDRAKQPFHTGMFDLNRNVRVLFVDIASLDPHLVQPGYDFVGFIENIMNLPITAKIEARCSALIDVMRKQEDKKLAVFDQKEQNDLYDSLQGAIKNMSKDLEKTLENQTKTLQGTLNGVAQKISENVSQNFAESVSEALVALQHKVKLEFDNQNKEWHNSLNVAVLDFSKNISELSKFLEDAVKSTEDSVSKRIQQISQVLADNLNLVKSSKEDILALVQNLNDLNKSQKELAKNTDAVVVQSSKDLTEKIQKLSATVQGLLNNDADFAERFANVLKNQDDLKQLGLGVREVSDKVVEIKNDLQAKLQGLPAEIERKQRYIATLNSEPYWANVFHDTIINSSWLKDKTVSPGRWAVSYIVLYVLYRVLNEFKPKNILECGLGQSSKLTVQYANAYNADLKICENNPDWIKFFENNFQGADKYINLLDAEMVELVSPYQSRTYAKFKDFIGNNKFDMVLIDGPLGTERYSRPEILDIVDNLMPSFVIMLDDMNRIGEQDTWKLLQEKLKQKGIEFKERIYASDKSLGVICSPDLAFLTSL